MRYRTLTHRLLYSSLVCDVSRNNHIKLVDFGLAQDWQTRVLSSVGEQLAGYGEYVCVRVYGSESDRRMPCFSAVPVRALTG